MMMRKGKSAPAVLTPFTPSVPHLSRRLAGAAGLIAWLAAAGWSQAEDRTVSLSRFDAPLETGKLIYAYPAVTVESSVWGENYSGAPSLRSMPTASSVQSSVWSSSYAPAPESHAESSAASQGEPTEGKHRKRKPAPEETEPAHPKKHGEAAEEPQPKFHTQPHLREKEETEQKEVVNKEVVPPVPEKPLIQVSGSAGYYSRYMFRGLDVAYRTGIDKNNESAFVGTNAAVSIGDFALGAWYIESLDSYVPGGAGFDKSFGNPAKDVDFRTPPRERYQEYDLFANYTFHLTKDLNLSTGMNFYWFSDGRFWAQGAKAVDSTMEAAATLNWTGIKYLNQSLSYYYDFDAFKGQYLEYKVGMHPIELYRNGDFAIGLSPNASISYDFRYNGTNNGWNNFEPGIDMPIHISDGLSLNVGVKYSWDLNDKSVGAHGTPEVRTDDRLWFSASFQYNFPIGEKTAEKGWSKTDGKALSAYDPTMSADNGRWRISAGAGLRTMHANFNVGRAAPYDINSLFTKKGGGGDLTLASDSVDSNYLDGSVFGFSSNYGDGTADFTMTNQSQLVDDGLHGAGGIDRQVIYHSERYNYSSTDERSGFQREDDDQVVYPYLNLSYDVFKSDRFTASIGAGYQFNHSSMQSGTQLIGLQTATENHAAYQFIYNVDELFSTNDQITPPIDTRTGNSNGPPFYYLIYDAGQYNNSYNDGSFLATIFNPNGFDLSPLESQRTETDTRQVVATVATFRSSQLDMDMHTISLPIDLSYKLTDRIRARLSGGPTFNIFNSDLSTETDYQLLEQGNLKTTKVSGSHIIFNSPLGIKVGQQGTAAQAPTGKAVNSGMASSSSGSSAAGGKGSEGGVTRKLPGTNLRTDLNHHAGQNFEVGVFGQLSIEVDLDAAKRWFVELYARYDYVPSFAVSDGATSSFIDTSSWGSGIGLGFHF